MYQHAERLFCTVGVHPTRCSELEEHPEGSETYMAALLDVILEGKHIGKVVAVGEMGLDYDRCAGCRRKDLDNVMMPDHVRDALSDPTSSSLACPCCYSQSLC